MGNRVVSSAVPQSFLKKDQNQDSKIRQMITHIGNLLSHVINHWLVEMMMMVIMTILEPLRMFSAPFCLVGLLVGGRYKGSVCPNVPSSSQLDSSSCVSF